MKLISLFVSFGLLLVNVAVLFVNLDHLFVNLVFASNLRPFLSPRPPAVQ
ncbi:hypothetical protein [Peribacillus muralis]